MTCTTCSHPLSDHDQTFRMCNQERPGTQLPLATRCETGCMQYAPSEDEA